MLFMSGGSGHPAQQNNRYDGSAEPPLLSRVHFVFLFDRFPRFDDLHRSTFSFMLFMFLLAMDFDRFCLQTGLRLSSLTCRCGVWFDLPALHARRLASAAAGTQASLLHQSI